MSMTARLLVTVVVAALAAVLAAPSCAAQTYKNPVPRLFCPGGGYDSVLTALYGPLAVVVCQTGRTDNPAGKTVLQWVPTASFNTSGAKELALASLPGAKVPPLVRFAAVADDGALLLQEQAGDGGVTAWTRLVARDGGLAVAGRAVYAAGQDAAVTMKVPADRAPANTFFVGNGTAFRLFNASSASYVTGAAAAAWQAPAGVEGVADGRADASKPGVFAGAVTVRSANGTLAYEIAELVPAGAAAPAGGVQATEFGAFRQPAGTRGAPYTTFSASVGTTGVYTQFVNNHDDCEVPWQVWNFTARPPAVVASSTIRNELVGYANLCTAPGAGRFELAGSTEYVYNAKMALGQRAQGWSEMFDLAGFGLTLVDEGVYPPLPHANLDWLFLFLCNTGSGRTHVCISTLT